MSTNKATIDKNRYEVKNLKRIEKLFNKLKKYLPKAYANLQLAAVFTRSKNFISHKSAFAVPDTICIGTTYINENISEMAIVEILGHEIGHHVLGHVSGGLADKDPDTVPSESDCDHFSLYLAEMAGYKRKDFLNQFGKTAGSQDYFDRLHYTDVYLTGLEQS